MKEKKMWLQRFSAFLLILFASLAFGFNQQERIILNDSAFLNCVKFNDDVLDQWIVLDALRDTIEAHGFDLERPTVKTFDGIMKYKKFNIDFAKVCRCTDATVFKKAQYINRGYKCITEGMPDEQAKPVLAVLQGQGNVRDFIENYEAGVAKTYVLTFVIYASLF